MKHGFRNSWSLSLASYYQQSISLPIYRYISALVHVTKTERNLLGWHQEKSSRISRGLGFWPHEIPKGCNTILPNFQGWSIVLSEISKSKVKKTKNRKAVPLKKLAKQILEKYITKPYNSDKIVKSWYVFCNEKSTSNDRLIPFWTGISVCIGGWPCSSKPTGDIFLSHCSLQVERKILGNPFCWLSSDQTRHSWVDNYTTTNISFSPSLHFKQHCIHCYILWIKPKMGYFRKKLQGVLKTWNFQGWSRKKYVQFPWVLVFVLGISKVCRTILWDFQWWNFVFLGISKGKVTILNNPGFFSKKGYVFSKPLLLSPHSLFGFFLE